MPVWTPAEMHHNAVTQVMQGNSHVYEGIPGIITHECALRGILVKLTRVCLFSGSTRVVRTRRAGLFLPHGICSYSSGLFPSFSCVFSTNFQNNTENLPEMSNLKKIAVILKLRKLVTLAVKLFSMFVQRWCSSKTQLPKTHTRRNTNFSLTADLLLFQPFMLLARHCSPSPPRGLEVVMHQKD